ncbi:hypothetical protein DSCO28_11140 [Desulfosarcina ovata subsp. sediminis]|uniref:Pentapeptide repeat-containing protein n=2 Tax=Desulfosarcina ovata TaxID=83564 RepID=A0A5K7ZEH1_9BACT|nr:hypothetical protein DSCO28_11140 [Desulfosarcina ovata subsp. sediminis]
MKRNLTPEEQDQFSDISAFNRTQANGFELRNRVVENMDWSKIDLRNATLQDLEFKNVKMADSRITRARFINVQSTGLDLKNAKLTHVTFENCQFDLARLDGTQFIICHFIGCRIIDTKGRYPVLNQCVLRNCELRQTVLEDANLGDMRFEQSRLANINFSRTNIKSVVFDGSRLSGVTFSLSNAQKMTFVGSTIDRCGFNQGQYKFLIFEKSSLINSSMGGLTVNGLRFIQCAKIDFLTLQRATVDDFEVQGCDAINEWNAVESTINRFNLTNSRLKYTVWEVCQFHGPGLIDKTRFDGANFTESTWKDIQFRQSEFTDFLVLTDGKFYRVHLTSVRLDPRIEIDDAGVSFEASDDFRKLVGR